MRIQNNIYIPKYKKYYIEYRIRYKIVLQLYIYSSLSFKLLSVICVLDIYRSYHRAPINKIRDIFNIVKLLPEPGYDLKLYFCFVNYLFLI